MIEAHIANPSCPYCDFVFEKIPSRQRKCPKCKGTIYVRGTPPNNEKKLMSEAMLSENSAAWQAYHYEITKDRVAEREAKTNKEENEKFEKNINIIQTSKDHHDRMMAFHQLALFYWKKGLEFRGDQIECLRGKCIEELSHILESGSEYVHHVSIIYHPRCQYLKPDNEGIYTIANALALMPLPHRGLDDGLCLCCYEMVLDDELPDGYVMPRPEKMIQLNLQKESNPIPAKELKKKLLVFPDAYIPPQQEPIPKKEDFIKDESIESHGNNEPPIAIIILVIIASILGMIFIKK